MPNRLTGTETEIIEHFRKQNREHQQAFLDKNRDLVNARRRELYALKKGSPVIQRAEPIENIISNVDIGEPKRVKITKRNPYAGIDLSSHKSLSFTQVASALYKLIELEIAEKHSILLYIGRIKTIMDRLQCDDFLKCINTLDFIDNLESLKRLDGSPYSINSIRAFYEAIVYTISHLKLKISPKIKTILQDKKAIYKTDAIAYQEQKQATEHIPSFEEYENKVIETFGKDSMMHLITRLYYETEGARDNFGLVIVDNREQINPDSGENYIIVPSSGELTIVIDQFKTNKKYIGYDLKLSLELSNILRQYIKENGRSVGDYLFGKQKLSKTISQANKIMGFTGIGAVNLFRKMMASYIEYDKLPTREQQKIANRFKHSIELHKKYLRQN